ncbi:putative Histidine kinase [Magnetospirillum sp. LM-5]|uniref:sensor histidine kinase n=1 Tax=Magnetospirillum sp. LM-5 TaxID=2681466 RepID=UPI00137FF048|nr:ATP-binding protein [Magnetospirillum sp. LM-5]CAA7616243.1 putative Histidine kinase [Magnetospirillum sp. LM-5]
MGARPASRLRSNVVLFGGLATIFACIATLVYLVSSYLDVSKAAYDQNIVLREKAKLAAAMREIVYYRTYMLSYVATIDDYFERDEERQKFNEHARHMIEARLELEQMGLNEVEQTFFARMGKAIMTMRPIVDHAMELAVENPGSEAFLSAMREARTQQLDLQNTIVEFADYYTTLSDRNSAALQNTLSGTLTRTLGLSGLVLVLTFAMGLAVLHSETRINRLLRTAVEERTAELRVERDRADHANQFKSKFMASMSHELRTPLNAIIGFSDLIRSEVFGPITPARYVEYAHDICSSGTYLLSLINEILDLSKIEAGEYHLYPESFLVQEVAPEALTMLELQAARKGITLVNRMPDDLPGLWADRRTTKQILLNLMTNAVKFTPRGGTITLAATASGGFAEISVSDTGQGMTAAEAEAAMRPFVQIEHGSPALEGTGLGLPLCRSFAEMQGGRLSLFSEPGQGTRVSVTVPLASTP